MNDLFSPAGLASQVLVGKLMKYRSKPIYVRIKQKKIHKITPLLCELSVDLRQLSNQIRILCLAIQQAIIFVGFHVEVIKI